MKIKKQLKVIDLLLEINRLPLNIHWEEIIEFQVKCLKGQANDVGIPDLVTAQNVKQNSCEIYSLDKHFQLLNQVIKVVVFIMERMRIRANNV